MPRGSTLARAILHAPLLDDELHPPRPRPPSSPSPATPPETAPPAMPRGGPTPETPGPPAPTPRIPPGGGGGESELMPANRGDLTVPTLLAGLVLLWGALVLAIAWGHELRRARRRWARRFRGTPSEAHTPTGYTHTEPTDVEERGE